MVLEGVQSTLPAHGALTSWVPCRRSVPFPAHGQKAVGAPGAQLPQSPVG